MSYLPAATAAIEAALHHLKKITAAEMLWLIGFGTSPIAEF
jgi:hypothetical protein